MRQHKKAGVTKLLALGTVFLAGAYAQTCTNLTTKVESTARETTTKLFGQDLASKSRSYQRSLQTQPVDGFEGDVYQTIAIGLERLPELYQERSVVAGLGMLSDSSAYSAMQSRIRSLPLDLRTELFLGSTIAPGRN